MADIADLRLRLKRVYSDYYLDLCSTSIPDPSQTYEVCRSYLAAWSRDAGTVVVDALLDEEIERIAGEVEQDLRQRHKDLDECLAAEPIVERLREVVEQSRG